MTLEELMLLAPQAGLRINNLFQHSDGTWHANVIDTAQCVSFGTGATPTDATVEAYRAAGCVLEDDGT